MLKFISLVCFAFAPFAVLAAPAPAPAIVEIKTVTGQTVQATLDAVQAGVQAVATAGNLTAADSILPNADGSFAISRPRILANGKMARISPGGAGSSAPRVCQYFKFKNVVGNGFYELVPRGETVADVETDGSVSVGSNQNAIAMLNCK